MATNVPMAAADDTAAPAADDAAAPAADTGADDSGSSDTVLVTITKTADGTYMVYSGDEPEEGGDDEAGEGDEAGQGGAAPMADDGSQPEGKACDSMGAALKAAMDILKEDESAGSGEGSADDNFSAGFNGGSAASPAKPTMAQKY